MPTFTRERVSPSTWTVQRKTKQVHCFSKHERYDCRGSGCLSLFRFGVTQCLEKWICAGKPQFMHAGCTEASPRRLRFSRICTGKLFGQSGRCDCRGEDLFHHAGISRDNDAGRNCLRHDVAPPMRLWSPRQDDGVGANLLALADVDRCVLHQSPEIMRFKAYLCFFGNLDSEAPCWGRGWTDPEPITSSTPMVV